MIFQIYVLLIQVFGSEKSRYRVYLGVGYGLPLLTVCLSLLSDHMSRLGTYSGNSGICWMSPNAVFYSLFLAPVCIVVAVNMSMLTLVIVKVMRIEPRPYLFGQARGWMSLITLLGGTWYTNGIKGSSQVEAELAVNFQVFGSSCQGVVQPCAGGDLRASELPPGHFPLRLSRSLGTPVQEGREQGNKVGEHMNC